MRKPDNTTFECLACGAEYDTWSELEAHQNIAHNEREDND